MKKLFIPAIKKNFSFNPRVFDSMPSKLHLLYSIQFQELAWAIKNTLKSRVIAFEQVLGCSKIKPKAALLLVGSGRFHAVNIAFDTKKPVYIYNNDRITEISSADVAAFESQERVKLAKFLHANTIGVIVSTKSGQNKKINLKELEKSYPGKRFYLFVADNIHLQELENFEMDFWVNTACPGLVLDSEKIINIEKIKK